MTYKLNNTVTIFLKDGTQEAIPCSYLSYSQPNGISVHGKQGTPIHLILNSLFDRVSITDNPTEEEEEVSAEEEEVNRQLKESK